MKRKIHRFLTQFYGETLALYLYTVVVVVVCETFLIEGTPSWELFSSLTISGTEVYFTEYSRGDPIVIVDVHVYTSHAHYQIEFISASGAFALRFRLIEFRPYFTIFCDI